MTRRPIVLRIVLGVVCLLASFDALAVQQPLQPPASSLQYDSQPVITIACASLEQVTKDLNFLGDTINNREFAKLVGRIASTATGIESLEGLDARRPWGAVVLADGVTLRPLAFVPVTDSGRLMELVGPALGGYREDDGAIVIGEGPRTFYAREERGWLFVGQTRDSLARLPDPAKIVGELPKRYDLSLTLRLQHVPEALRSLALDMLFLGGRSSALDDERSRLTLDLVQTFANEAEQVTLGFAIDQRRRAAVLDVAIKPIDGTPLADFIKGLRPHPARFAWLGDERSAIAAHVSLTLSEPQRSSLQSLVSAGSKRDGPADDDAGGWSPLARSTLHEAIDAMLAAPNIEAGIAVDGDRAPLTARIAAGVPDGMRLWSELEADLGASPASAAGDPAPGGDSPPTDEGPRLFSLAETISDPAIRRLWGDELRLAAAPTADSIRIAVGPAADRAWENPNPDPSGDVPPVSIVAHLSKLFSVAGQTSDDDQARAVLAIAALNLRGSDDRLSLTVETRQRVLEIRLEAGEGILRSVAAAAMLTGGFAQE